MYGSCLERLEVMIRWEPCPCKMICRCRSPVKTGGDFRCKNSWHTIWCKNCKVFPWIGCCGWMFTPWKINMEHNHIIIIEVWKIIILSKWVICMFHVNPPGCTLLSIMDLSLWKTCVLEVSMFWNFFERTHRSFSRKSKFYIGGCFKDWFILNYPEKLQKMNPFDEHICFKWVGFNHKIGWLVEKSSQHPLLSNENNPGCLGYIGGYTTLS